jgi:hypothetical protein
MDWTTGVWIPPGARTFSLRHRVQIDTGARQNSYAIGMGAISPGGKAAGAWSWPLPPSAEVKNTRSYVSTSQYAFMAWCLVKHRDSLTKHHAMKTYVRTEVQLHAFLTAALDGDL